jgi:hypothetical protein
MIRSAPIIRILCTSDHGHSMFYIRRLAALDRVYAKILHLNFVEFTFRDCLEIRNRSRKRGSEGGHERSPS